MTNTAVFAFEYLAHGHRCCACFRLEYLIVAVFTIQPFGMHTVREHNARQTAGIIHNDFSIQLLKFGMTGQAAAWAYITIFEGTHPVNPVSGTV